MRATGERATGSHGVVLGAGIGGLLAARVLSDLFEHVTVIERDQLLALGGYGRHRPPTDPDGFLDFARSIMPPFAQDQVLTDRFLRVTSLLDPPARLLSPAVVGRVLAGNLRRGRAPAVDHRGGTHVDPVRG
jgi:Phytoene dehydrogenase and related proteins